MKILFTNLFVLHACTLLSYVQGDDHDHAHKHACACEAIEFDFSIDCSNQDAMLAALPTLQNYDCSKDCSSDICFKNFLIIQSHHDYCLHNEVPEAVEDALHIYEDVCPEHCEIKPKYDPELTDCPAVACGTRGGNDAFQAMVTTGCVDDCTKDGCADNFRILKAFHDTCPEDDISQVAEMAFHDYDSACDDFSCNIAEAGDATTELVCTDPDVVGASKENSAAATTTNISLISFLAAVAAFAF